jgi:nucleoside-diphosphate-sugar epimerase
LDGVPSSIHAKTRLEEERYLFSKESAGFNPVSLRAGMVYGKGILMIDAAKWLLKRRLMGVWRKPTWIHLISTPDFLSALKNAVTKPGVRGIYHVGDDGVQTLQEFLDAIAAHWGYAKPWRMPLFIIRFAALCCEAASMLFNIRSPLTLDFVTIGAVSYYGDTARMKKELLKELKYKNFRDGMSIM